MLAFCVSVFLGVVGGVGGKETYQLLQTTDEMVVTGTLMVQGQSEMVRVVASVTV